jgi:integrase
MLSYRVFFFTLYSLGLRLGEGLALTVADTDVARRRVHIRAGKGNEDRFVPLGDDAGVAASLLAAAPQSGATVSPSRGRTRGCGLGIHPAGSRRRAAGLAQGRRGVRA